MDFENYMETPIEDVDNKEAEISAPDEKVKEKVEKKNRNKKPTKPTKECKVLSYIKSQHFIIISFDGNGIRIDGVENDPGETVTVEYSGKLGTPDLNIEIK